MAEEWFQDQEFWTEFREHMFSKDRISRAEEQVEQMVSLLGLEKDERILDLPCGVGRHSLAFAEKGSDVVGVDISKGYIQEAKDKAEDKKNSPEFEQGDMKQYSEPSGVDVVLNLWNSFGYFEKDEDNQQVLQNFQENLRSGGKLLIELKTKETIGKSFGGKYWMESGEKYFLQEHEITDDWRRHKMIWTMIKKSEKEEKELQLRLYSAEKLSEMLERAGFTDINCYGDFEGSDFDSSADRLVVVAEKQR